MTNSDKHEIQAMVQKTVTTLREAAHLFGKADRGMTSQQIEEVEAAAEAMQNMLDLKKRMNSSS